MHDFETIDSAHLDTVTGGGKLGAIWNGAKTAYNTIRPIVKESAEVAKDVGIIGGIGYGAKKMWDSVTGGGSQQKQPAQP